MKPLRFDELVKEDVQSAVDYYSTVSAKIAARFITSLDRAYEGIRQMPSLRGRIDNYHRAAPVRRFPYLVIYRIRRKHIDIVSVHHVRKGFYSWRRGG